MAYKFCTNIFIKNTNHMHEERLAEQLVYKYIH